MENIVLVHGSLGTKEEYKKIVPFLEKKYTVSLYEIPHHGEKRETEVPFDLQALVDDFLLFLKQLGSSYVYGFSFGGYLALSAAIKDASSFKGIITQGTKWRWSEEIAEKNIHQLHKKPESKGEKAFQKYLENLHDTNLKNLIHKTALFTKELGGNPFITTHNVHQLTIPVRMIRGGKDKVSTREGTLEICRKIPKGNYFEIPGMIHPVGFVSPKLIARLIAVQLQSMHYKWLSTSFGKMAYQKIGSPQKEEEPVVLFLHDSLGSIAQWADFPQKICDTLHLSGIVMEFPGYGFSDSEIKKRGKKYLHEFAWEYFPAFLKALSLPNPIILVGHSDGGTNSLLYSSKFSSNIKAVITLAAHYKNEKKTREGIRSAVQAYREGKFKGLECFQGDKTERLFREWSETWLTEEFKTWNIAKDIKGGIVPTLVVQGDKDQYGTDQQVNGIVDVLKNGQPCFIKNCGHSPHLERQEETIEAISNWVKP